MRLYASIIELVSPQLLVLQLLDCFAYAVSLPLLLFFFHVSIFMHLFVFLVQFFNVVKHLVESLGSRAKGIIFPRFSSNDSTLVTQSFHQGLKFWHVLVKQIPIGLVLVLPFVDLRL